jgi:peptidylprolyl isomerase
VATAVALTGCGGSNSSGGSPSGSALGIDAVHVTGDVGTAATVSFDGQVTDPTATSKVETTGSGPVISTGDTFATHIVIADGYTQKTAESSYQQHAPQVVTLGSQLPSWLQDAVQGKTVGSRIVVYSPAETIVGAQGNSGLGIGNTDMVVVVLDLVGRALDGPNGASHAAPSWAPAIKKTKGVVSGLGFSGTPHPDGHLHSGVVRAGTGATVKKGQVIAVDYLGAVYKGKQPFDESFSKTPLGFPIGEQQVVAGWDKTLVGQKVGSEILLQIPPKDGYGKQGKPEAGIKGTDTLYFVVDILGAF